MEALDLLTSRRSANAKALGEPAPDAAVLDRVFAAAVAAPDHGALRPWRFQLIRGAARERLGDLMVEATRRREPEMAAEKLEELRLKPLRAPLIVAIGAKVNDSHPKVPVVEQVVAVGAAVQSMLLALQAQGFAGVLLTGPNAHDPLVKAAFGLAASDELVGFLYVGTPLEEVRERRRPDPALFVREWSGEAAPAAAAD